MNKVRASSGSYYYGYGNYGPSANGQAKSTDNAAQELTSEGRQTHA